jgi:hypothetical protein
MAMIPSYQDMLAQALQQQPQQQQSMGQSQQSKSIFNNPAFGNSLMKMGLTMLTDSEQGYSLGESIGRGGLAFMDERRKQEELQREEQRQNAILARQQLQDNLQKMALQREAMTYDAAAQAAQNLPEQYRLSATVDPLGTVKQQMTDTINAQDAERKFAQQVQLQNMQYGNDRALAEYKARQGGGMGDLPAGPKEYMWMKENLKTPEEWDAYMNAKRADPYQTAFARAQGAEQGGLQLDIPTIQQNSQYMIDTIDRLEKSPGFDAVFGSPTLAKAFQGGSGAGPAFPGTDAANAKGLREQVQDQAFLDVYERLRGAQGITNIEGEKGQNAFANLKAAQSPEEAKKNLQIIKEVVKKGLDNLNKRANMPAPQFPRQSPLMSTMPNAQSPAQPMMPAGGNSQNIPLFNPNTGKFE